MPRQARDNKQKVRKTNQKRGWCLTHTHTQEELEKAKEESEALAAE
eukprot:COSAG06_NODE_53200_length_301_cov_1.004950_1_plen_45_part_10